MIRDGKIPKRILGLNVKQVDKYLENLNKCHMAALAEQRQEIEGCYRKRDGLTRELEQLATRKEKQARIGEFSRMALERTKSAVALLLHDAEKEAESIVLRAQKAKGISLEGIPEIENTILGIKRQLEALSEDITILKREKEQRKKEKERQKAGRIVGKIIPAAEKKMPLREAVSEKAVNVRKSSVNRNEMTADGSFIRRGIYDGCYTYDDSGFPGFWDNIDGILSKESSFREYEGDSRREIEEEIKPAMKKEAVFEKSEREEIRQPEKTAAVKSPAVEAQIEGIRHKYIVGKIAGKELLDKNGQTIVTEGDVITVEVIEKAETDGKLPELIVNMLLPGMKE